MTAPKETTPPPSTGDSGGESKLSAGTLRAWIKEEIKSLVPTPSAKPASTVEGEQPPADIKAEVATALEQLKAREDRKNKDARVDKMLEEFEKPKEEVAPKEVRKVHKFMGWGE